MALTSLPVTTLLPRGWVSNRHMLSKSKPSSAGTVTLPLSSEDSFLKKAIYALSLLKLPISGAVVQMVKYANGFAPMCDSTVENWDLYVDLPCTLFIRRGEPLGISQAWEKKKDTNSKAE